MLRDEHGDYIKVYKSPKHWNDALFYMVNHMTDAKLGQIVNFGKAEMKIAKATQKQLDTLIADKVVFNVKDDLYMINPFLIGNGDWIDVSNLQDVCVEFGYVKVEHQDDSLS